MDGGEVCVVMKDSFSFRGNGKNFFFMALSSLAGLRK